MTDASILIFADELLHPLYQTLNIEAEKVEIYSCSEAFDKVPDLRAHVITIDCGQKIDKGLLLLEDVKTQHPNVPVILLTDVSSEEYAVRAFRLGAREYIRKPVNIFRLQKMIALLLEAKRDSKGKKAHYNQGRPLDRTETISDAETDKPVNILNAIRYMEENFADNISLARCAQEAKLSKYYFSRHFKDITGLSPLQYVNMTRVTRAKELLASKGFNILEVAFCVGFRDYSSFLKNFKKYAGMTPRQFRNSIKLPERSRTEIDWVLCNCLSRKPCCKAIFAETTAKNT